MTRQALVLGGTGHVGGAVLAALHREGVPAWFTFHTNEARAGELARVGHRSYRVDLRRPDDVRALIAAMAAAGATPDVLVHCAAANDWRELAAIDDAGWDDVHAVGLRAPFLAVQALVPHLGERGADIVLCAGLSAARGVPAHPHAAAAHAGIAGLTRSLARALGPRNVRVNALAIGILDGGTADRIGEAFARDHRRFTALGRTGTAAEVAEAIAWLALANRYASGVVLPIAGGI